MKQPNREETGRVKLKRDPWNGDKWQWKYESTKRVWADSDKRLWFDLGDAFETKAAAEAWYEVEGQYL